MANRLLFQVVIILMILTNSTTLKAISSIAPTENSLKENAIVHTDIAEYNTRRYIDTDGSTMVIGAYESSTQQGAAFVYEKEDGEWIQKAVLTSTDNTIADHTHFGYAVAIKGDVIVIGAPLADEAYIFEKPETGWEDMTETLKISSPLPKGSYYGFSLAMNENNIAVSAYRYSNYRGRILLYQKDTDELWSQVTFTTTTLLSVQPRTNEYLGYELRMDEDALVSGALGYNSWQGRLYVYNLPDGKYLENNITPDATLAVKDGGDYQVGIHVAIDKNVILATDYGDDQKGTIHVFRKEEGKEWEDSFEAFSITDDALIEKDYYGADLDVDNNEIIIGASQGKNEGLGKVYHYILSSTNAELINVYETDQVNKDDHFAASVHFTDEDILVSTMYNKEYPFFSFSRRKDVTNLEVHVNTQKPFLLSSHPKYGISDKIEFGHLNTKTYSYKLIDINGGIMKEGLLPESGIIQLDQKLRGIKIIQLIEKDKVYIYKLLR
ncbi:FG-GAP repeat protein [Flammeovirga yaeyamensis]|uniref:FG-GAP repeat protein n=1 Tax=Flammeovirga yaeyamensis TaxID=367791 RepID=UPI00146B8F96|nr:FG-GAP repeat protein [Flammeovirga yaeyamensis]NMF33649.1 hypothetical protein [Flammeovirga yaeyamensis]